VKCEVSPVLFVLLVGGQEGHPTRVIAKRLLELGIGLIWSKFS